MYLIITIDTEGDNAWAAKGFENETKNLKMLPRFQEICDKYNFPPTYLCSHEVATDAFFNEFAADVLKSKKCEIGMHPHPWNSPPTYNLTSDDMQAHPYMIEYPEAVIRDKLKLLTDILEQRFCVKMQSHRAGRWAFNNVYAHALCDLGYIVDCSVTPHVPDIFADRRDLVQVALPDYKNAHIYPYFCNSSDILKPGDLPLLEIPMTIVRNYSNFFVKMYDDFPRYLQRISRGLFGLPHQWFRPMKNRPADLLAVARKQLMGRADYIMFMIHSSEFMPGANPQFKTQNDIDVLFSNIADTFAWLHQNNVSGVICKEYYEHFMKQANV